MPASPAPALPVSPGTDTGVRVGSQPRVVARRSAGDPGGGISSAALGHRGG